MIDNRALMNDFIQYCALLNLDVERVVASLCFAFLSNQASIQTVLDSDSFFESFEASYGI